MLSNYLKISLFILSLLRVSPLIAQDSQESKASFYTEEECLVLQQQFDQGEREPTNPLYFNLALSYQALGEKTLALGYFQRALSLDPFDTEALKGIDQLGGGRPSEITFLALGASFFQGTKGALTLSLLWLLLFFIFLGLKKYKHIYGKVAVLYGILFLYCFVPTLIWKGSRSHQGIVIDNARTSSYPKLYQQALGEEVEPGEELRFFYKNKGFYRIAPSKWLPQEDLFTY